MPANSLETRTIMSNAINPKGARQPRPGKNLLVWVDTYLATTVGQKVVVGISGALFVGFVVFHMIGNLKMFSGQDSINAYAHFLKHDLGALIWIARAGLLGIFLAHAGIALRLKFKTNSARPIGYVSQRTAQASPASMTMVYSGIVVLLFIGFHLAHYTFCWLHDADLGGGKTANYLSLTDSKGRHDVYSMVIAGFSTWWISAIYLVSQLVLFVHLSHGIPSVLQTLGLIGQRFVPAARALAYGIGGVLFLGNAAIVLGVWVGFIPPVVEMAK
jgi:succinate dehydrogenase / fumarate reductase cytochrome b subunit